MLKFTNRLINKIDKNVSDLMEHHLGGLVTERIDKQYIYLHHGKILNFTTNSCLGLESDERIKAGIIQATERNGASFIVSRIFISPPQFAEFSRLLHHLFESYPVVTASTTLCHLSALPVLIQKHDVVILDEFAHNSLRLATLRADTGIRIKTVRHNNMQALDKMVSMLQTDQAVNNIWYLADGVYSMLGSHCVVMALTELLDRYSNFYAYIDDAHGMSIMGKHGRGFVLSHFDQQPEKMVVAVSLSKSFGIGCGGAVIVPNAEWQRKIRRCGPTRISSSPIPIPMLGAGIASAKIHLSDEITMLQDSLRLRMEWLIAGARRYELPLANEASSGIFYFTIGEWEKTVTVARYLLDHGMYVNACTFPAVPMQMSGIRIVLTVHHTQAEIEHLVKIFSEALLKFNMKATSRQII